MFCIPLFFDPSFRCSKLDGGSSTAELIAVLVDSQHSSLDNETNGDVPNCSTEQEGWRSTEQFQLKSYEEQDSSCYTSGTLQRQYWWTAIYTGGHKSQRVITAFMRAHLDDSVKGWFWHRRGAFVPLWSHCKLYIESLSFRCFANRALSN